MVQCHVATTHNGLSQAVTEQTSQRCFTREEECSEDLLLETVISMQTDAAIGLWLHDLPGLRICFWEVGLSQVLLMSMVSQSQIPSSCRSTLLTMQCRL